MEFALVFNKIVLCLQVGAWAFILATGLRGLFFRRPVVVHGILLFVLALATFLPLILRAFFEELRVTWGGLAAQEVDGVAVLQLFSVVLLIWTLSFLRYRTARYLLGVKIPSLIQHLEADGWTLQDESSGPQLVRELFRAKKADRCFLLSSTVFPGCTKMEGEPASAHPSSELLPAVRKTLEQVPVASGIFYIWVIGGAVMLYLLLSLFPELALGNG